MTTQLDTTEVAVDGIDGIQGEQATDGQGVAAYTHKIKEALTNVCTRMFADIEAQPFGPSDALFAKLQECAVSTNEVTREWKRTERHFMYEYTFRINQEEMAQTLKRSYKKIIASRDFSGFRRGKIPYPIFLQRVGKKAFHKSTHEEVINEQFALIRDSIKITTMLQADVQSSSITDESMTCTFVIQFSPPVEMPDEQHFVLPHIPEQNEGVEIAKWGQLHFAKFGFDRDALGERVTDACAQQFDRVLVQCVIAQRVQNSGGRTDEDAKAVFDVAADAYPHDVYHTGPIILTDVRDPFVRGCIGRREQSAFFVDIDVYNPHYVCTEQLAGEFVHFLSAHLMNTPVDLCDGQSHRIVSVAVLIQEIHRLPSESVAYIAQIGTAENDTSASVDIPRYYSHRVFTHFLNERLQTLVQAMIKQSTFVYSHRVLLSVLEHVEWRLMFIELVMKEQFLDFDQRDLSLIDGLEHVLERVLKYGMKLEMLCNQVFARTNMHVPTELLDVDLRHAEPRVEFFIRDHYGGLQFEFLRRMHHIEKTSEARDILLKMMKMQAVGAHFEKLFLTNKKA